MNEIGGVAMERFLLAIFIIITIVSLFTILLHKVSKTVKFIKYTPGTLALLAAGYYFYLSRLPSEGFLDIARFLLAIMLLAAFLGNLVTGLVLDFRNGESKK